MVRWLLPTLCVGCAGGAPVADAPSTCGEAECAAACAEGEAQLVVPEGGDRLTRFEALRLVDVRKTLVTGIRGLDAPPVVWCLGTSTCEQALLPGQTFNLPGGAYVVALSLRFPAKGSWEVTVDVKCSEGGPADQRVRLPVNASSGVVNGPFVPVVVPTEWTGTCTATVLGPDGRDLGVCDAAFSLRGGALAVIPAAELAAQLAPQLAIETPTSGDAVVPAPPAVSPSPPPPPTP